MLNIKSKAELVAYCIENQIEFIDFHYCGWDGRLKTLNFVVRDKAHLLNMIKHTS